MKERKARREKEAEEFMSKNGQTIKGGLTVRMYHIKGEGTWRRGERTAAARGNKTTRSWENTRRRREETCGIAKLSWKSGDTESPNAASHLMSCSPTNDMGPRTKRRAIHVDMKNNGEKGNTWLTRNSRPELELPSPSKTSREENINDHEGKRSHLKVRDLGTTNGEAGRDA